LPLYLGLVNKYFFVLPRLFLPTMQPQIDVSGEQQNTSPDGIKNEQQ
jgi:hypothetical protein